MVYYLKTGKSKMVSFDHQKVGKAHQWPIPTKASICYTSMSNVLVLNGSWIIIWKWKIQDGLVLDKKVGHDHYLETSYTRTDCETNAQMEKAICLLPTSVRRRHNDNSHQYYQAFYYFLPYHAINPFYIGRYGGRKVIISFIIKKYNNLNYIWPSL